MGSLMKFAAEAVTGMVICMVMLVVFLSQIASCTSNWVEDGLNIDTPGYVPHSQQGDQSIESAYQELNVLCAQSGYAPEIKYGSWITGTDKNGRTRDMPSSCQRTLITLGYSEQIKRRMGYGCTFVSLGVAQPGCEDWVVQDTELEAVQYLINYLKGA